MNILNSLSQNLLGFILFLNSFINDFGISVIIFTLILKIILFPFEFIVFLEEIKIKKLKPKISEVFQKYRNDLVKQFEELNKLYKEENYNPFTSIFIQLIILPIFLLIFLVLNDLLKIKTENLYLLNFVDLRAPNFVIVFLIGIIQLILIFNMPKEQRNISFILFGFILFIIFKLPSLISLYWLTNLILTLIERYLIFNKINQFLIDKS